MRKEPFGKKKSEMWISMIMTFFCSSETSMYILQQWKIISSLWHSFPLIFLQFLPHQWGFLLFWSKVQWVDFLIYEVKGLIMGTKDFQIAFEWLSVSLLNVNLRRLLCFPVCGFHVSYISLLFLLLHIMLSHSFYFRSVLLISNILLVIFFFFGCCCSL